MLQVSRYRLQGTYAVVLLLWLLSLSCAAQVHGRVAEIAATGDTTDIPGALLFLRSRPLTVSDINGGFHVSGVRPADSLFIEAPGYARKVVLLRDTTSRLLVLLHGSASLKEVDVVYYSSGTEISSLSAQKLETLGERSLMKAACCNLSESFETNPSIDVNFADAVSGAKQIQMLGLSGQYAQITRENMPYLRGLSTSYGLTFIPGTWIRSIQLSKGAGSVVNGYESFTGQINTELQDPESSDKLFFNAYTNANARNEYNLNLARKLNPAVSVGLLGHMSFNPLVQDLNGDGFADIPVGRQYNLVNKYAFRGKKGFEAQVGGGYLLDDRRGGQFSGTVAGDSLPLYRISLYNEKWDVYSKTGKVFRKRPGTSTGLQLSYTGHTQRDSYGPNAHEGVQRTFYANYIFQGILGISDHSYKAGASYLDDAVHEKFNLTPYDRHERDAGAFAEYAYNSGSRFNAVAGARLDAHNYYGVFFTPRLHLRYAFTPASILRFSGGKALRTANIFSDNAYLMASSRRWIVNGDNNGLPYGLKPERAWNYGLNFTQKFKVNYRDAYITVDAYRTDFINQVVVDVDASARTVLLYNLKGPSYSNTIQFEYSMEPRKRLFVKTAYRFVDTRVTFNEGLLRKALVSRHRAFLNFSYETSGGRWQFDQTTQYIGPKRIPRTGDNPPQYRLAGYSPGYFNLLAQVTWLTMIRNMRFHIYVGVENALNYRQPAPIVASDAPFGKFFDASMVWGPIYGRMMYAGLRLRIK